MLVTAGNSICRHSGQEHLWPVAEMWEFVPVLDGFGENLTGSDMRAMQYFSITSVLLKEKLLSRV